MLIQYSSLQYKIQLLNVLFSNSFRLQEISYLHLANVTSANRHRPKVTFHLQRKDVTDDVDVAALFVVKIHQRHGDEPVYIEKLFTLSEVSHQPTQLPQENIAVVGGSQLHKIYFFWRAL